MAAQRGSAGTPCPQCGSGLPINTRFCPTCGHLISTRQAPQYASNTTMPTVSRPIPAAAGQIRLAGRGVRCSSFLLDLAAMLSPALPLSIAGAVLGVAEVVYIVVPIAFAAVWAWLQIWQGLTGTSFGKAMLGLRLVRAADHRLPGVAAAMLRSGVFLGTFGLVGLPVMLSSTPQTAAHDRISRLVVLDVATGANPLGARQQTPLRRSVDRGLNRVQSPVPVVVPRQG